MSNQREGQETELAETGTDSLQSFLRAAIGRHLHPGTSANE